MAGRPPKPLKAHVLEQSFRARRHYPLLAGEELPWPGCGSGTCLIAAERHGRRCLTVELDPVWCDLRLAASPLPRRDKPTPNAGRSPSSSKPLSDSPTKPSATRSHPQALAAILRRALRVGRYTTTGVLAVQVRRTRCRTTRTHSNTTSRPAVRTPPPWPGVAATAARSLRPPPPARTRRDEARARRLPDTAAARAAAASTRRACRCDRPCTVRPASRRVALYDRERGRCVRALQVPADRRPSLRPQTHPLQRRPPHARPPGGTRRLPDRHNRPNAARRRDSILPPTSATVDDPGNRAGR